MENKRNEKMLNAISNIDDDIIGKHTETRMRLFAKMKKRMMIQKRIIPIVAVAAGLLLIVFGLNLFAPLFMKTVPVYQGMTVSKTTKQELSADLLDMPISLDASGKPVLSGKAFYDQENTTESTTLGDSQTTESPYPIPDGGESAYYIEQNGEILISVHINNPSKYEILSFTLNGKKYSSYMFEDGSDLETLILRVNVGSELGIMEYTIDQIKYVDGEKIKDVKMDGDRTVSICVGIANHPSVEIASTQIGCFTFSADASLVDEYHLISQPIKAILYQGESKVAEQEWAFAEDGSFAFDRLEPETDYRYQLFATYDALDELGTSERLILEGNFRTEAVLRAELIDELKVKVVWCDASVTAIKLENIYGGQSRELALDENMEYQLGGGNYVLRLSYEYDSHDGRGVKSVSIALNETPICNSVSWLDYYIVSRAYSEADVYYPTLKDYRDHLATDFFPQSGSDVYVLGTGVVQKIYRDTFDGLTVEVDCPTLGVTVRYSNLGSVVDSLQVGDVVQASDVIGKIGDTSMLEMAEESHLHLEVIKDEVFLNPATFFDRIS